MNEEETPPVRREGTDPAPTTATRRPLVRRRWAILGGGGSVAILAVAGTLALGGSDRTSGTASADTFEECLTEQGLEAPSGNATPSPGAVPNPADETIPGDPSAPLEGIEECRELAPPTDEPLAPPADDFSPETPPGSQSDETDVRA